MRPHAIEISLNQHESISATYGFQKGHFVQIANTNTEMQTLPLSATPVTQRVSDIADTCTALPHSTKCQSWIRWQE